MMRFRIEVSDKLQLDPDPGVNKFINNHDTFEIRFPIPVSLSQKQRHIWIHSNSKGGRLRNNAKQNIFCSKLG